MNQIIKSGSRAHAMVPETFDELQRMAKVFLISETFKPSYQASDEKAFAECCIVIQRGLDVGLSPTQAVEGIALIKGKTMIYGDTLTAILLAHGCAIKKWHTGSGDSLVGHAKITRPDGEVIEKSYSAAQAKEARLWDDRPEVTSFGKTKPNDSPWFRFKERMLEWRAFGHAVKDGASDYSKGLSIVEEMAPRANNSVDITPTPALPDLPDIPDEAPVKQIAPVAKEPADQIADQAGFIEMVQSSISACESRKELAEVITSNADVTKRCSPENRQRIAELYREALA